MGFVDLLCFGNGGVKAWRVDIAGGYEGVEVSEESGEIVKRRGIRREKT